MAQADRRLLLAHRFEKSSARISFRCGWIQVLEWHQGPLSPCISFPFLCVDCILRWLLLSLWQPGYLPLQDCVLSVLRGEKDFPPGGSNLSSSVEGHWITWIACGQACADWPGLGHMTPAILSYRDWGGGPGASCGFPFRGGGQPAPLFLLLFSQVLALCPLLPLLLLSLGESLSNLLCLSLLPLPSPA